MARLFNAYVMVDWSAAAKPATGADSIWIGVLKRDVRFRFAFESHNPSTRKEAETLIGQHHWPFKGHFVSDFHGLFKAKFS